MQLDRKQKQIVTCKDNNIIVSAGAGSGKTRVLTERVKYIIESGVDPSSIVCITFTNKAANEMRERLAEVKGVGNAFIGTIHSFANHILKDSGKRYDLLTADKESEIIRKLISNYGKYTTIEDYTNYIKWRNMMKLGYIDHTIEQPSHNATYEIDIFYGKIEKPSNMDYPENLKDVCAKNNIITFDELIKECTSYFRKTGGRVEYLLVDEFQDIGMNEYDFIMALNAEHNFMVGDDWQSIYGFKGGDVHIFLSLMRDPNWTSFEMTTNYRNSKSILTIAKSVIKEATDIINKRVSSARDEYGSVEQDSKYNLNEYLTDIKISQNYKDWFILARTNKEIYELSNKLYNAHVPYKTFKQGNVSTEELNKIMDSNTVKLLTIHASKGLENKNVIIYGNFQVKTPKYKRVNSEERKIFYVAITRAMDKLIILS